MDKLKTLLGLAATATDDDILAAVTKLHKANNEGFAQARIESQVRTMKLIATKAGLNFDDWDSLVKADSDARAERAIEIGLTIKSTKPKGKAADEDEQLDAAAQRKKGKVKDEAEDDGKAALDAERAAHARQIQDNYLTLELKKLNIVHDDLLPVVLGSVKRDALKVDKTGDTITGVSIPDDELQRLRTALPSAFKAKKDPQSPKPGQGGTPEEKSDIEKLATELSTKAADAVAGKLPKQ